MRREPLLDVGLLREIGDRCGKVRTQRRRDYGYRVAFGLLFHHQEVIAMKHKIQRILAAVDGSEQSEEAFAAIMPLIWTDNSEVTVLHVLEAPAISYAP